MHLLHTHTCTAPSESMHLYTVFIYTAGESTPPQVAFPAFLHTCARIHGCRQNLTGCKVGTHIYTFLHLFEALVPPVYCTSISQFRVQLAALWYIVLHIHTLLYTYIHIFHFRGHSMVHCFVDPVCTLVCDARSSLEIHIALEYTLIYTVPSLRSEATEES